MINKNLDVSLFALLIITYSIIPNLALGQSTDSGNGYYELHKVDSALNQVGVEYEKAETAISVNDAEKIYLDRFSQALQDKRKEVCKKINKEMKSESCCR